MSSFDFYKLFSHCGLRSVDKRLCLITGEKVCVEGICDVRVKDLHENKYFSMELFAVKSITNFTPLLGRPWLDMLVPNWREFFF